jgi:cytochrome c553
VLWWYLALAGACRVIDHKCQYAAHIGQSPKWQTDENGLTVCVYCHAPKETPAVMAPKPATKTLRK